MLPAEFVAQDVEAVEVLEVEELAVGEPEDTARLLVAILLPDAPDD